VQYLDDMDDVITQLPDKTPRAGRQMMEMTSPISYFVLLDEGLFAPVAIQINSKKGKLISCAIYIYKDPKTILHWVPASIVILQIKSNNFLYFLLKVDVRPD